MRKGHVAVARGGPNQSSRARKPRTPPIEAPPAPAASGDVHEDERVQERQLSLIHRWKEARANGELPVKLDVRDRHLPAGEEGFPGGEDAGRDSTRPDEP